MNHTSAHATSKTLRARAIAWVAAAAFGAFSAPAIHAQAVYPTPDAAADAFADALAINDHAALRHVLGNDYPRFIPTDDIGEQDIYDFLGAWSKEHKIVNDAAPLGGAARAHIEAGGNGWTLPIPLVQGSKGWKFDLPAARDEILTRRIGRNERSVMLAALGYVDAQRDYQKQQQHYAQRFVSAPGKRDGLYWDSAPGEPESPLGPLAATMPNHTLPADAYHGYHYKILTAQGPSAQGGAQNYITDGEMSKGFGLVAWPAEYGKTGVMTFIVNQDGQVYQKNLGRSTAKAAAALRTFNPDDTWQPVSP
ncbi:DUF2950 domain-containing protein [Caballeronia humi]|uniref:DUF2950 domain-containing protein n=1 Tax=Caballeronia humi TaxID=326474 RepID=A0A158GYJ1_9BURK|nr:DUF2950 domain-containing protein [Caballeronia humi]SAL37122.1 hypothetical protein AWB65_02706 [Caballeronia humi]